MITRFDGHYKFLSNFFPADVELDGILYPTVEHAYQAAKTIDKAQRQRVLACANAAQAKRIGKNLTLRKDWDDEKLDIMLDLLRQKFDNSHTLAAQLVMTGDTHLIEGNTWGDRYWGAVLENGQWVGGNNLGKLLMQVREELRSGI